MDRAEEKEIDRYMDRFLNGPKPVPGSAALRDHAEALRQRLHTVGYDNRDVAGRRWDQVRLDGMYDPIFNDPI